LQLITQDWALPGDGAHGVYSVSTSLGDNKPLLTAYALKRPDGQWSVLIVNKDTATRMVTITFDGARGHSHFAGRVDFAEFGRNQYRWNGTGAADAPNPDRGVIRTAGAYGTLFGVPPESLEVIRGSVSP
jgi:hypothetical protein